MAVYGHSRWNDAPAKSTRAANRPLVAVHRKGFGQTSLAAVCGPSPAAASLLVVAVRPGSVFRHADLRDLLDMNGYTSADVLESDIAYP